MLIMLEGNVFYTLCGLGSTQENKDGSGEVE